MGNIILNKLRGMMTNEDERKIPDNMGVEVQNLEIKDGQEQVRTGFNKLNATKYGAAIKGLYGYRNRHGLIAPLITTGTYIYEWGYYGIVCDDPITVGVAFTMTLTKYNVSGDRDYNYNGTANITENGAGSLSVTSMTFIQGVATTAVQTYSGGVAGSLTITATDNADPLLSASITISVLVAPPHWELASNIISGGCAFKNIIEYGGKLYVAGDVGETGSNGALYEYNGTDTLTQVAPPNASYPVYSLALYDSKLYGMANRFQYWNDSDAWVGSEAAGFVKIYSFDSKLYMILASQLYQWNGSGTLTAVSGAISSPSILESIAVFGGKLYTSDGGKLIEWNGTNAFADKASSLGVSVDCLCVHGSKLYGTTDNGQLLEWNGTNAWATKTSEIAAVHPVILVSHDGNLYGSELSGTTSLLKWNGTDAWEIIIASGISAIDLISFGGELYAMPSTPISLYKYVP